MSTPESEERDALHKRVSKDHETHRAWRNSGDHRTHAGSNSNPILEFPDAHDDYVSYMWEVIKNWPPTAGWSNWYAESQTLAFRRWSTFDLALGRWISGLVKPLKEQLEASRFCEHIIIDPTPHFRYLCLPYSGDVFRPNFALNMEGLGKFEHYVGADPRFKFPVMVILVASRETLEATRDDMWRYMWMADGCRIGIIFIVNSFYDQHLNPFVVSMEIWSKRPEDSDLVDDCPSPDAQAPPGSVSTRDERLTESGLDNKGSVSVGNSQRVDDAPILERNEDGFLTYRRFTLKPVARAPVIVMRHKEEIIVVDETKPEINLPNEITLRATDFMPLCGAQARQEVEIKSIKISLESLRECIRQEWRCCHTPEPRPQCQWDTYNIYLAMAYASRSGLSFDNL